MQALIRQFLHVLSALLALIGLLSFAPSAMADSRFSFDGAGGNLSKQVRPRHYALTLALDPESERFDGKVRIEITVRSAQRQIELHALDLSPSAPARLIGPTARDLEISTQTDRWLLRPQDGGEIAAGRYTLELAWRGVVQRSGQGLFAVPYKTPAGADAHMLATQFQAHHARRVLPCFDEPAFRASFALQVLAPQSYEVLSNTPVAARKVLGDRTHWRFSQTPAMPTYLLALSVGRFERISERIAGVQVAVVTTEGKREQGRYALAAMRQLLPWMRSYFGSAYPLPKLDLLAVPGVRQGAMEDWGLISFDELYLLVDPVRTPLAQRLEIYDIVAHELAHQWFGNLVTPAWWDDIWLNEAFATWLAAKASAHFNPSAGLPALERLNRRNALARDAGPATRAIRSGPVDEAAVMDVFDQITYDKGGAVLTMLEEEIGAAPFRSGLARFMREHAYSNATAPDLWRQLSHAAGRDLLPLLSSWIEQPGYPLIDVTRECVGGNTRLRLSQQPFRVGEFPPDTARQRWQVPLRLRHQGRLQRVLLVADEQTLSLPGCDADRPVLVNAGGGTFARVRYLGEDARRHAADLAALPESDRLMLLEDGLALAQAGLQPVAAYIEALRRVPALPGEEAAVAALQAANGLLYLHRAMTGRPQQLRVDAAGIDMLSPLLQRFGWQGRPGDALPLQQARSQLIERLALLGDADVRRRALQLTDAALAPGGTPIDPPIRAAVLRAAVLRAAGTGAAAATFDRLLHALANETRQEQLDELIGALGSVQSPDLVERALALTLDEQFPAHLSARLLGELAWAPGQPGRVFEFALKHFEPLAARSSAWTKTWLLPRAASGSADPALAERLLQEQQQRLGSAGQANAAQVAQRIRQRADFALREAEALQAALRAAPDPR